MERKKLPIGIQTFREIRDEKENRAYIDKTEMAFRLIDRAKYYFLSRPRRFGKSLFLDTLSEIFKGSKHLFEGLYIYDKWDWGQSFPIIKINFASGDFSSGESIKNKLKDIILLNAESNNIPINSLESDDSGIMLERLIRYLSREYNKDVVVLIDEYDKPILDNIGKEDKTVSLLARDILRNFYGAIKSSDEYLRFVFITGVSKFSKMNLFSGLNNIQDITLNDDYATITGYTHEDVWAHFEGYLEGVDPEEVKRWYNGYNYFGKAIYNPYDILLFLANKCEFQNYWWETGNPRFLIDKLKEGDYFLPDLENISITKEELSAFDVEYIDLVALLWQTGYLTFDEKINRGGRILYKMKVPNLEIMISLNTLFLNYLTNLRHTAIRKQNGVYDAMEAKDMDAFEKELVALFASIPYENYVNNTIANYEGYYASVMFVFLSSLGFTVYAEESTNRARIDMTLVSPDSVFILEFKVDKPSEIALHQIETKKYYQKYTNLGKPIFLIGVHFDSKERNISGFEWKEYEK